MRDKYIFEANNLTVGYGQRKVVSAIDLKIEKGTINTVIGANGCGKSTFLKTISRQINALSGSVILDGKDLSLYSKDEFAKKSAIVLTGKSLMPQLSVFDVVSMGRYPYTNMFGTLSDEDIQIVNNTMKMVNVYDLKDEKFDNLSDGQKKRALLSCALCQNPDILILDEPTTYLDIKHKLDFFELLINLKNKNNLTVIMSLHELEYAREVSDKVICIKNGCIDKVGAPIDIFEKDYIANLFGITTRLFNKINLFPDNIYNDKKDNIKTANNEKVHEICKNSGKIDLNDVYFDLSKLSYSREKLENLINNSDIEKLLPLDIEKRSFEIIENELCENNIFLDKKKKNIIKRAIHTTADFEYVNTLKFSKDAVDIALNLIRGGANIVTDTNMAKSGISKSTLSKFGGNVYCFMSDEEVANISKNEGTTRADISMKKAAKELGENTIFAIGNAPTALLSLFSMYEKGIYSPAFIIGVPVGFVNVVKSKELIMQTDIPYIVNRGRKGGSNVAAAICNALLYELVER